MWGQIRQQPCRSHEGFPWGFGAVGLAASDGSYYNQIVHVKTGGCLNVAYSSAADGALVNQYTCHNGYNQFFKAEPGSQLVRIKAHHSSKCLDVRMILIRTKEIRRR